MSKKIIGIGLMTLLIGVAVSWLLMQPSEDEVFVQRELFNSVNSVAFSPDGKTALSGSHDDTVKLWDLATGRIIKTLEGHSDNVNSVTFSPDGKTALSGSIDYKMKWWDLATGNVIKTLEGHSSFVNSVAFSPDGKTALSGSWDNTVKWWNLATGNVIKTFKGHSNNVKSVAFSPDGKTVLSSGDGTVKWWDLATGNVIKTLERHYHNVHSVVFSPDGKTALSGSMDDTVKWWNLETGNVIKTLEKHSSFVNSVAFSPDGKTALSGSLDDTVKWWNLATGNVIKTFKGHFSGVNSVAFSPDGKTALSGSSDTTICLWNLKTGEEIIQMVGFKDGEDVAIMPQGYYSASPNGEQYINVRTKDNQVTGIEKYKSFYHRSDIIKLALQLGDTERAIAQANQPKTQVVAQVTPEPSPKIQPIQNYHVVQSGESLSAIAARYGTNYRKLAELNQISKPYNLSVGQRLRLPNSQPAIVQNDNETQVTTVTKKPSRPPQRRLALIIGNAAYQGYSPLKNPVNDATDLTKALKKLNFEVIKKHNLNYAQMEEAILEFDEKIRQEPGVGLFYFSGHGVQYQGTNYLIPVDATRLLRNPKQLRFKAIAASYIQTTMEAAGNRVNLLILDACRNSPIFIKGLFKGEMTLPGLGYMVATSGSLIAYAASPGGVAKDGEGRNSPYVASLMNWIQKPNLSINKVLRGVRNEVVKNTDGKQSPGYYDELNEDFYFSR